MISFLTSSFVKYQPEEEYSPAPLIGDNDFVKNLQKYWPEHAKFLVFSSDPSDNEMTDYLVREMQDAFCLSDLKLEDIKAFDYRYIGDKDPVSSLREALSWCNVFFVSGGHCPTENNFIKLCKLDELIKDRSLFDGLFLSLSAGSVNSAGDVYLLPELPGESVDPSFKRDASGLSLTSLNIVPHYHYLKTVTLDGQKYIDELVSAASFERDFYLLPDGSYFIIRNGMTELFGECTLMKNGKTYMLYPGMVNSDNPLLNSKEYEGNGAIASLKTLSEGTCDFVLDFDVTTGLANFFHVSDFLLEHDVVPVNISSFEELCQIIADDLVVEEEKQPVLDQIKLPIVLDEIENKGNYVRTMHINTEDGVRAEIIRIERLSGNPDHLLCYLMDISAILDHDWMTDEFSRTGFFSRIRDIISILEFDKGESYSVVYSNIHGFKAVNDLFGTQGGDMCIFQERDTLCNTLHPLLIARFEADHFVLLVNDRYLVEDELNALCRQVYSEGSKVLPFTIRLGIYRLNDASSITHVVDGAKLAERSIQDSHGKPFAYYDENMYNAYMHEKHLTSELDNALEKNYIRTYYQPVVDINTEKIVSAEALVRWIHPEKGIISPGLFVPAFEKNGLISKIDNKMVNNVVTLNENRLKAGKRTVPCAVNLSRIDFYDMELLNTLKTRVSDASKIGDLLKLEVTESAYAVLEDDAIEFLNVMKEKNIALLLDDFGSGMSSFSTLESFEFDIIKLDMGFIRKIGKSEKTEAIIKSIIDLSHSIGSKVVAEGVETPEQLEFLRKASCDMIQGYYFYKPMSEEDFVKLLDEGK